MDWRKASKSAGGACVELANPEQEIWIRDSKRPEDGHQVVGTATFATFLADIKAGKYNL